MKKITKIITAFSSLFITTMIFANQAAAQLTNPVVEGALGNDSEGAVSGTVFSKYFVSIWNSVIGLGAIAVLVFFIWGAIEWITSGGDKGKLESARNRITQAVIGLIILVSSFVILGFVNDLFFDKNFNILNITIPNALQ